MLPLLQQGKLSEIIFVNDHSTDDSVERVQRFAGVRVLQSPQRGAGAARNVGWRGASADHVWFVDADCVVEPAALELLQQRLADPQVAAVGGSYVNLQPGQLVADLIHEEMVARHESMGHDVTFAITANLLCRRAVLEQLGGFDESLRLAQDLDLAYRIVSSGSKLAFDDASRVGHFHETSLLRYCYKQARQGYWRVHLYARHPGRATGDTYSGPADYVQPPLSLLSIAAAGVGLVARTRGLRALCWGLSGSSAALLLALQVPRTVELVRRTHSLRYLAYMPLATLRAGFRGAGMTAGVATLAWQRARALRKPSQG